MNTAFDTAPATFPTPWAARAFAIVTAVSQAGWFDLKAFQQGLIAAIHARESAGGCIADEAIYYDCWIEALTTLLRDKGVPQARLLAVEASIRQRLLSLAHDHDDDDHDHPPQPVFVESTQ